MKLSRVSRLCVLECISMYAVCVCCVLFFKCLCCVSDYEAHLGEIILGGVRMAGGPPKTTLELEAGRRLLCVYSDYTLYTYFCVEIYGCLSTSTISIKVILN